MQLRVNYSIIQSFQRGFSRTINKMTEKKQQTILGFLQQTDKNAKRKNEPDTKGGLFTDSTSEPPKKQVKVLDSTEQKKETHSPLNPLKKFLVEQPPSIKLNSPWNGLQHPWQVALAKEFTQPYLKQLEKFVNGERSKSAPVYPPEAIMFRWTHIPPDGVSVVIIGQDPYHRAGQANGLCFSVPRDIALPPSLRNIYAELERDLGPKFTKPTHGNLEGWMKQGVLLLNAILTVRESAPESHANQGWERFTDAVIKEVCRRNKGVVFLIWGMKAERKVHLISQKEHHVLKAPHPSPLSAHRGFLGCGHFSKCNDILKKNGKKPIDWSDLYAASNPAI